MSAPARHGHDEMGAGWRCGGSVSQVQKDGICLFHALLSELHRLDVSCVNVQQLRHVLLSWVVENSSTAFYGLAVSAWISGETGEMVEKYVQRMRRPSEWGGIVELFAASQTFGVSVCLWELDGADGSYVCRHCVGRNGLSGICSTPPAVHLFYDGVNHYDIFVPDSLELMPSALAVSNAVSLASCDTDGDATCLVASDAASLTSSEAASLAESDSDLSSIITLTTFDATDLTESDSDLSSVESTHSTSDTASLAASDAVDLAVSHVARLTASRVDKPAELPNISLTGMLQYPEKWCSVCQVKAIVVGIQCSGCYTFLEQLGGGSEKSGKPLEWVVAAICKDGSGKYWKHPAFEDFEPVFLSARESDILGLLPHTLSKEKKAERDKVRKRLHKRLDQFKQRQAAGGQKRQRIGGDGESMGTPLVNAARSSTASSATASTPNTDFVQRKQPKCGDPADHNTWRKRPGRGPPGRTAWNPITYQWVKPVSKPRGRPTRETLGKVWIDWAGEYVDSSDPRALPDFVNPAALREMEIRLEKEQERLARLQSCADVEPHKRPTDLFGRLVIEPATPAPLSEYRARHEEYLQNIQYGPLVQSSVSHVPPTELEHALTRVDKHHDEPRLSALNARRIELYEYKLEQMDLIVCANCSRLKLVDITPANVKVCFQSNALSVDGVGSTDSFKNALLTLTCCTCPCLRQGWCCEVCCEDGEKLSAANHMDPAPRGRPLAEWETKLSEIQNAGGDVSWLPPKPPAGAHYPPVYYTATLAETLLVTRFRTVMSCRHMPLYHKKFRGRALQLKSSHCSATHPHCTRVCCACLRCAHLLCTHLHCARVCYACPCSARLCSARLCSSRVCCACLCCARVCCAHVCCARVCCARVCCAHRLCLLPSCWRP